MKIEKLILKNFASIKNATEANEIEIDFKDTQNKICLLIGPNGSGKTSILSMMQPFADVGNLDIRNGNGIILKDKEGYKEIHISRNDDYYIIKHFYTPHKDKSHSVKSYIEKNGVELNVNGNVSSFKEYVKEELQIEPDYLKLIRLGSNVTSLIGLSPTERKNFMSKIMDEIGVYLEYYKSVNMKLRQLNEMISHTIDKVDRLGIINIDDYEKEIEKTKKELDKSNKKYIKMSNDLAILQKTIDDIDDVDNLPTNLRDTERKYKKMLSILERKDSIEHFEVEYYTKEINDLEKELLKLSNQYDTNIILINNSLSSMDSLSSQKRDLLVQLSKAEDQNNELLRIEDNANQIRLKLREQEDLLDGFKPSIDKKSLDDFVVFIKNIQNILNRTYEFGKKPIAKVCDLMKSNKNVMNYINQHLLDLDDSKEEYGTLLLSTLAKRFNIEKDSEIKCNELCPAKDLYNQVRNLIIDGNVQDKNDDVSFYHDMESVYYNLKSLFVQFKNWESVILSLPDHMRDNFRMDKIYENISNLLPIYNEKDFNDLLATTSEYERYLELNNQLSENEKMYSIIKGVSTFDSLKNQLSHLDESIENEKEKISNYKRDNGEIKEKENEINRSLEVDKEIKETLERFDEVKEYYESLKKDMDIYKESNDKIYELQISMHTTNSEINAFTEDIQKRLNSLSSYEELNKELKKMNKIFDEMTLVKSSLSAKEGIPLRIMRDCLDNTEEITNELLNIAYDGNIFIDKFNISPTEFGIPWYNKGVLIEDVKFASQGELSFLSLALSFALSSRVLSKYNIMLLDEIDGPLDSTNREKFIRILENQIERINSEQNFLITHNSMFSSYPVDIIDLSGKNDKDQYPLANFITFKKLS